MVIPWVGFPLAKLLDLVEPQSGATHVAFETYYDGGFLNGRKLWQ